MRRSVLIAISICLLFSGRCYAQLISTKYCFKEVFDIAKYRNDNCIANMLNTISVDAGENVANTNFAIFYEVEISDSLHFTFNNPVGDIFYSGYDISRFLLPEKVKIKCGSLSKTINIDKSIRRYSFAKPVNQSIAECYFFYSDDVLKAFNDEIGTIRTYAALSIVADTLISMLNRFSVDEKYLDTDVGVFLTFANSQIDYIAKCTDSIGKKSEIIDTKTLSSKLRLVEARKNSVALSASNESTGKLALINTMAKTLADNFCTYYNKLLQMANSARHIYASEIAHAGNFKRSKPDLQAFTNTLSEAAQEAFLNQICSRLLTDARNAHNNNNINISLILIDNYEYVSEFFSNSYSNDFHSLKVECLETLRDSYLKLADKFYKSDNYSVYDNYRKQANDIQSELLAATQVKNIPRIEKPLPEETLASSNTQTIAENNVMADSRIEEKIDVQIDEKIDERIDEKTDTQIDKRNDKKTNEKADKKIKIAKSNDAVNNAPPIETKIETKIEDTPPINTPVVVEKPTVVDVPTVVESISNPECASYDKKIKVLSDKIDSFTMFTIENLYNRYTVEHPECAKLSLAEWIKSIGREDLLPSAKKKRK